MHVQVTACIAGSCKKLRTCNKCEKAFLALVVPAGILLCSLLCSSAQNPSHGWCMKGLQDCHCLGSRGDVEQARLKSGEGGIDAEENALNAPRRDGMITDCTMRVCSAPTGAQLALRCLLHMPQLLPEFRTCAVLSVVPEAKNLPEACVASIAILWWCWKN